MNAFSGREKIGKGSHEDFGKIAIEMIKKLDKELPTLRSASFWLIALLLRVRCGLNAHAPMLRQLRATSRKHSHYVSHCSHRIGSTPTGPAEHWSDQQVIFTAAAAATVVGMMTNHNCDHRRHRRCYPPSPLFTRPLLLTPHPFFAGSPQAPSAVGGPALSSTLASSNSSSLSSRS